MELTISSPCPKRWESLIGNDRVRYCGECNLNVYNLTVMPPSEIEQLLHRTGGRLCVQIYVRKDRTGTLRDCPGGRRDIVHRRVRTMAIAFGVLFFGLISRGLGRPDMSGWPDWVQTAANWIHPELHPFQRTMGSPCPIRPVPVAPPAPTATPAGN